MEPTFVSASTLVARPIAPVSPTQTDQSSRSSTSPTTMSASKSSSVALKRIENGWLFQSL